MRWSYCKTSGFSESMFLDTGKPSFFSVSPCLNHSVSSNAAHLFERTKGFAILLISAHFMIILSRRMESAELVGGCFGVTEALRFPSRPLFAPSAKSPPLFCDPTIIYGGEYSKGLASMFLAFRVSKMSKCWSISVARTVITNNFLIYLCSASEKFARMLVDSYAYKVAQKK